MTTSPPIATSNVYTPLERLLLFQSLRAYGVEHTAFSKVSDSLKANPAIRDSPAFDPSRLAPAALKEVYLTLLKDEIKNELETTTTGDDGDRKAESAPSSRKRKAPSPHLPTVREAAQHAHLVPQLIIKLYSRYQEQIIHEIRHEEEKYGRLQTEVVEIESGHWDVSIRQGEVVGEQEPVSQRQQGEEVHSNAATADVPGATKITQNRSNLQQKNSRCTSIDALINHPDNEADAAKPDDNLEYITEHSPTVPSLDVGFPQALLNEPAAAQPYQSPPHLGSSGAEFSRPQSAVYQTPHGLSHAQNGIPPLPLQAGRQISVTERSSLSPRILPPPPGMQLPPPNGVALPSALFRDPQYRAPPRVPSQRMYDSPSQRYSLPVPASQKDNQFFPGNQLPSPQSYYAHPSRNPYSPLVQQNQPPSHYPPRQGGIMLPPFQVAPQEPIRPPHEARQSAPSTVQSRTPFEAPQPKPYGIIPTSAQAPPNERLASDKQRVALSLTKHTPALRARRLTLYKSGTLVEPPLQWLEERPSPGAVSPQLLPSEILGSPSLLATASVEARDAGNLVVEEQAPKAAVEVANNRDGESSPAPARRRRGRRRKAGSNAPSTVASPARGRTGSLSAATPAIEHSLDLDTSTVHQVKPEPSTPAAESSVARSRELRASQTRKRKRDLSEAIMSPTSPAPMAPPSTTRQYILCTRNFPRISQPIMQDIQSHKYASLFSNPVKSKDVRGYTDIIRRPQDLKSIRAAISAGGRAVVAATSDTPQASPPAAGSSKAGGHVLLPISPDLVPPRGIVNSAQLERELMRMFANAIMFNPGEEDVVSDAREMFSTAERSIENWRSAGGQRGQEGRAQVGKWDEEGDDGDAARLGGEEGVEEGGRKRRRL